MPDRDEFEDLKFSGQLLHLHRDLLSVKEQLAELQGSIKMAFANLAAQEDTEAADLVALGTALDSLLALQTSQSAQITQFIADNALAPAAATKLQAIIDTTNAELARVQAALPVPPAA